MRIAVYRKLDKSGWWVTNETTMDVVSFPEMAEAVAYALKVAGENGRVIIET